MMYLPRLFVYHVKEKANSAAYQTFLTMEKKLLKLIMLPAMLASLIFGLILFWVTEAWLFGWMHGKILFLLVLFGFHGFCSKTHKNFAKSQNTKSEKFYRVINEIPAFCIILIVIFVVMKPF